MLYSTAFLTFISILIANFVFLAYIIKPFFLV